MSARQTAALLALQEALTAAFLADSQLAGLVKGRIHDSPPRGPVLPYLSFAEARARDFSGGDSTGTRALVAIEAMTGDGERARALDILDAAVARATETPLVLGQGTLVLIRQTETQVERLKDGRSWRARAVLEALIDE